MKIEASIEKDADIEKALNGKWESQRAKTYSTQSHKKLLNYFLDVIKTDLFQERVTQWREKYNIPANGFADEFRKGVRYLSLDALLV